MFEDKSNLDVITVLMLLGEATIWKVIWSRFRTRRAHWKNWVFPVSPGWTPLAGTLFAALSQSVGPPNLIFDRAPEGALQDGLILTNLDSGASHNATNPILQNMWQTWNRGPREEARVKTPDQKYDLTREVGVVDVDLSTLRLKEGWAFWFQPICLATQIIVSLTLAFFGWSFEVFVVFMIGVVGQALLLVAVVPRNEAWNHRVYTNHPSSPMILHRGLDSTEILVIRRATLNSIGISLEEFCWDSQAIRNNTDSLMVFISAISFIVLVFQIILIGWMSTMSRELYFALGTFGLFSNAIEAASQPKWMESFGTGFSGVATCAVSGSSLMGGVGILLAGEYSAAEATAKLLYPDNDRFRETRDNISQALLEGLCSNCRFLFRDALLDNRPCLGSGRSCTVALSTKAEEVGNVQIKHALAAVCRYLQLTRNEPHDA